MLRNPPIHVAIETQPVGYGAITAETGINALIAPNLTHPTVPAPNKGDGMEKL